MALARKYEVEVIISYTCIVKYLGIFRRQRLACQKKYFRELLFLHVSCLAQRLYMFVYYGTWISGTLLNRVNCQAS